MRPYAGGAPKARRFGAHVAVALGVLLVGCGGGGTQVAGGGQGGVDTPRPRTVERRGSAEEDFARAVSLWRGGPANWERVESLLEDVVADEPSFAEAWFNLGVVREARGNQSGAIEAYRQSNAADRTFVDGLSNIAAILLNQGREQEARQLLTQVVETDQFHPGANLNQARLHRQRVKQNGTVDTSQANEAINRIRLSLAGDAMNVAAYETLADVYHDLGRHSLAQLVCNTAIALGLESPSLYNRYGLILLSMDDVTGAYAQFRRAVALDEAFTEASMNLGAVALNYRDYAGALAAFETVLRYDRENVDAMISRAVALRGLEELDAAEQGYRGVLERDGANLSAIYNLGILYQEYHQDYEQALEWFQRYLREDSGRRSAQASDVEIRVGVLRELIELLRYDDRGSRGAGSGTEAL
jgi:tetratricopeptide (TPR) repeat protein